MSNGPWIDVTIERLAESGEGMGFDKSGAILVRGAMPGDRLRVQLAKKSRAAAAIEWVETAPDRVEPPCPVAEKCGGCTWQHVPSAAQRDARLEALRRSLPRERRDFDVRWHDSPAAYGYRTRARIAWKCAGDSVLLGHRAAGSHDVVDAVRCPVLDPALERSLATLRTAIERIGGEGEVFLARGAEGRPVATLRAKSQLTASAFAMTEWLCAQGFAGVELYAPGATAPGVSGDPRPVFRGADGAPVVLAPEGFAQANEALNSALVQTVVERAKCANKKVLELFAGAGNFTVALARVAKKVSAVELDARAVRAMRDNVVARGLENVACRESPADVAAAGHRAWDVIVLDPPRTGASEVVSVLVNDPPKRLVYVSCEPATFGRDASRLEEKGLKLESLDAFEMFPQTPHVELVGVFSSRSAKSS
ncbi:MAG: RsmD family RNA methyltransferase [Polyangiales bacterium]